MVRTNIPRILEGHKNAQKSIRLNEESVGNLLLYQRFQSLVIKRHYTERHMFQHAPNRRILRYPINLLQVSNIGIRAGILYGTLY